ncbi:hypothetical protein RhiirA1_477669 [Rhizophagus irregularis]|uniref:Uncharacterized protein n=1 Tax=Rhizophagus irregularis TaxID=588596 RepID=A0A2N0QT77_9GLOM|nr:hypothetical protein RhiirA1_477669 [Rhizophagus irregularis]
MDCPKCVTIKRVDCSRNKNYTDGIEKDICKKKIKSVYCENVMRVYHEIKKNKANISMSIMNRIRDAKSSVITDYNQFLSVQLRFSFSPRLTG